MLIENYRAYTWLNLVYTVAVTLFAAVLPIYAKRVGLSDPQLGLMYLFFPLAVLVFLPIVGGVADMLGKRRMLVYSTIVEILALGFYLSGLGFGFFVARFLNGVAAISISILTLAKFEDKIKERRGGRTGFFLSVGYIGRLFAPPIGLLIANYFSIISPFVISLAILFVLLFLLLKKGDMHIKGFSLNYFRSIREFLAFPQLRGMALLGVSMHFSLPVTLVFMPLFVLRGLDMPMPFVSLAVFAMGLPMIFQYFFGRVSDLLGPRVILFAGVINYGIGIFFLGLSTSFLFLCIALLLVGIGNALWNVGALHLMSNTGEKIQREGMVLATYTGIAKLGSLIGFGVSGFVVSLMGFKWLCLITSFVILSFLVLVTSMRWVFWARQDAGSL